MGNRTGTISRRYRIRDDDAITVTVVVGAGQPGGWSVSLDNRFLAEHDREKTIKLGKGIDLLYRELRIEIVLHDRRWEHDRLIASVRIAGGPEELRIVHEQPGEPGDSATYTVLVQFV
jgi:hypothetical protein